MNFFRMPKPRGFNHKYIYYDERRARLRDIEERARRELGMAPTDGSGSAARLRGAFTTSARRRRTSARGGSAGRGQLHTAILVFILIALLALLRYLL